MIGRSCLYLYPSDFNRKILSAKLGIYFAFIFINQILNGEKNDNSNFNCSGCGGRDSYLAAVLVSFKTKLFRVRRGLLFSR
jgi:hypothetical protein